jgi:hypothetical protein
MGLTKNQRKYQGVTAYAGMPGSGKTYALAQLGVLALKRGEQVWSNRGFDFAVGSEYDHDGLVNVFGSFEEMCTIDSGLILLDEAPLYFNSRKWGEFPDGFFYKLTQIRKDGVRFAYSTIHQAMVDVNIRRVTFFWFQCRAVTNRWLVRSKYPHEDFRGKDQRVLRREWALVKPEVADLYDTLGKVAIHAAASKAIADVDGSGWARPEIASPPATGMAEGGGRRQAAPPRPPAPDEAVSTNR